MVAYMRHRARNYREIAEGVHGDFKKVKNLRREYRDDHLGRRVIVRVNRGAVGEHNVERPQHADRWFARILPIHFIDELLAS